jgi:hypothetical protein
LALLASVEAKHGEALLRWFAAFCIVVAWNFRQWRLFTNK